MPAYRYTQPDEGWNQNKTRTVALFYDQHKSKDYPDGRCWWGYTETPADPTQPRGVVGELQPVVADMNLGDGIMVKGWEAPWIPEAKYVNMAAGMLAGNRFKLDYSRMIVDYAAANEKYYRLAASTAGARNWPAPKMYGQVDFQLRAIVGDPPKSPKVPEAASAGDPWILGFEKRPNERLKKILDREQGRMVLQLEEADDAEHYDSHNYGSVPVASTKKPSLLESLSDEDVSDLMTLIKQRKQAATARSGKKSHTTQNAPTAA